MWIHRFGEHDTERHIGAQLGLEEGTCEGKSRSRARTTTITDKLSKSFTLLVPYKAELYITVGKRIVKEKEFTTRTIIYDHYRIEWNTSIRRCTCTSNSQISLTPIKLTE
jgi:hypothetical protein